MSHSPTNPDKPEKYNHRGAGTETWEQEAAPREKTEADKELDEALESGKKDIPFPGDDAWGPEDA